MNLTLVQADVEAAVTQAESFAKDAAVYKTLLESTRAIPWKIDWASMQFTYIGPQIEEVLGWPQDSWVTVEDWATRMHDDDREEAVNFCVAQSQEGIDHEVDYRALTKNGDYVWIRDVVHVVRKPDGEVDSLIGFMFDITERKHADEEVARLQQELERLSFSDGLTGIANRRLFDQRLEEEWSSVKDTGKPLSLILLDVDCFKQYNDVYGHLAGDECLRRIASTLREVTDSHALVARFGGEEFAVLLPETGSDAARNLAESILAEIKALAMAHEGSKVASVVTASMGVVTALPDTAATNARALLESVDYQLYAAKANGRARFETAVI